MRTKVKECTIQERSDSRMIWIDEGEKRTCTMYENHGCNMDFFRKLMLFI